MRVLVTGGCGFIGSHLVDALYADGHEIAIYDDFSKGKYLPNHVISYTGDIRNKNTLAATFKKFQPEVVFHLAAHHYIPFCESNPYEAFSVNVMGTINVADCCSNTNSVNKLFYASTGDVYPPVGYASRESDTLSPVYIYGETKLIGEQILKRYKSSSAVSYDITIGRLFNAAGSRETNPHLLPEISKQLDLGVNKIEVGNLWPIRDFIDVCSMASVIKDLTFKTRGLEVINIGSGQVQTVEDAITTLVKSHNSEAIVISVDERKRPNDRPFLCPNVDRLRNLLGRACDPFTHETAKSIFSSPVEHRFQY